MYITALLLTATALAPSFDVDSSRARAAKVLRLGADLARPDQGIAPWVSATQAAIDVLGDGAVSATLEASILDARWRATHDPAFAVERLGQEVRAAIADLEFTVEREAPLPVGFPPPTPVRDIQLKEYPAYRQARASMASAPGQGAFGSLFRHITGNGIAMTAPVEMSYSGDSESPEPTTMAFLYGAPDVGEAGRSGDVEVVDIAPALVVSLGVRGSLSSAELEAARGRLTDWIGQRSDLAISGDLRVMSYNSPGVAEESRYHEVQYPVRVTRIERPLEVVVDFGAAREAARWAPVNDTVMGGRSSSRFRSTGQGSCVFEGRVSLENNGGFASVRRQATDLGLGNAAFLQLAFRGDGKDYKLRLRTEGGFRGVSYEVVFPTEAGVWRTRRFEAADFVPVWRGRRVRDAKPLDLGNAASVGLQISDKQVGAFRLEVSSLTAR